MKALVKAKREQGLWMQVVEKPTCGVNDVLIKIKKTALCGTDLHIYSWDQWAEATIPVPMVIGHEFMGEIEAVGSAVQGLKVGQRVSGEGHLTCGLCRNCRAGQRHLCRNTLGVGVNRAGCFAEYLVIPATNIMVLPDAISDSVGSTLDPLGNATHCALAFDVIGEDVLITGAGPIGLMAISILKQIGARHVVITDVNEARLELAKTMGATRAINVKYQSIRDVMSELQMREGFDVGLEMSGNGLALNDMVHAMNHGGKIALLGIPSQDTPLDLTQLIFKGLTIKGIYGREMFETWYKMIAMLQSGLNILPVITHELPAEQYEKAFEIMASGQSGKVILDWS